jgi:hypothetical protein
VVGQWLAALEGVGARYVQNCTLSSPGLERLADIA